MAARAATSGRSQLSPQRTQVLRPEVLQPAGWSKTPPQRSRAAGESGEYPHSSAGDLPDAKEVVESAAAVGYPAYPVVPDGSRTWMNSGPETRPPEQAHLQEALFNMLDSNGKGAITQEELARAFRSGFLQDASSVGIPDMTGKLQAPAPILVNGSSHLRALSETRGGASGTGSPLAPLPPWSLSAPIISQQPLSPNSLPRSITAPSFPPSPAHSSRTLPFPTAPVLTYSSIRSPALVPLGCETIVTSGLMPFGPPDKMQPIQTVTMRPLTPPTQFRPISPTTRLREISPAPLLFATNRLVSNN